MFGENNPPPCPKPTLHRTKLKPLRISRKILCVDLRVRRGWGDFSDFYLEVSSLSRPCTEDFKATNDNILRSATCNASQRKLHHDNLISNLNQSMEYSLLENHFRTQPLSPSLSPISTDSKAFQTLFPTSMKLVPKRPHREQTKAAYSTLQRGRIWALAGAGCKVPYSSKEWENHWELHSSSGNKEVKMTTSAFFAHHSHTMGQKL